MRRFLEIPMAALAIAVFFVAVFTGADAAAAIHKCEFAGKTTYTETPCPGGKTLDINDSVSATRRDSATQRAAKEKTALKRLEAARAKIEVKQEKEDNATDKRNAGKREKCDKLALGKKWAEEDAAKASGKAVEKAKTNARRAGETYALACR
jgi:hypothetical protein